MFITKYLLFTQQKKSKNLQTINHKLMLQSGMIRMISSGIYAWLPLGNQVLKNIVKIIEQEMNHAGALEISLPIIQPKKFWTLSGRDILYGEELINIIDRRKNMFILSPTYEEMIAYIMTNELNSYKQLPIIFYQIQKKFRDEKRSRFGILRTTEFMMKDSYSFHINKTCLIKTYEKIRETYIKIFSRLKIKFKIITADAKMMGGSISHEFHGLSNSGEDQILYTDNSYQAINYQEKSLYKHKCIKKNSIISKSIEIGHIFQLNKKYTKLMNTTIKNYDGNKSFPYMGCYGIGINRIIYTIIEQNHDEKGIIWPEIITPFQIYILPINMYKHKEVEKIVKETYNILKKEKFTVLLDDRNEYPDKMFKDMELIGIPHGLIFGIKNIKKNQIEYYNRKKKIKKNINIKEIILFLKKNTIQQ